MGWPGSRNRSEAELPDGVRGTDGYWLKVEAGKWLGNTPNPFDIFASELFFDP